MRRWLLRVLKKFLVLRSQGNVSDRLTLKSWQTYSVLRSALQSVEHNAPPDALRLSRQLRPISYTADFFHAYAYLASMWKRC